MTTQTMTCPEDITPETLSAFRDGALPATEMERIRAHSLGCAVCQATLAQFDALARTLAAQRIPAPDARLWRGVQARLHAPPPARLAWGGIGALASALVLVVLFTQVLGRFGGHTSSLVPTPLPTLAPTPSPVLASSFISPTQAWGKGYALAVPNDNSHRFIADAIFPDGSKIAGTVIRNNRQSVVIYDTHTFAMQTLCTSVPGVLIPYVVQTDGRYVFWTNGFSGAEAQNNQPNQEIIGFADLKTGQVHTSNGPNNPSPLPPNTAIVAMEHGYLFNVTVSANNNDNHYSVMNLATGVSRPLAFVGNNWQIGAISWPYILWVVDPHPPQPPAGYKLYNAETNQLVDAPGMSLVISDAVNGNGIIALSGTTVFWLRNFATNDSLQALPQSQQLYQIDHIDQPHAQLQVLTPQLYGTGGSNIQVNDRLVVWSMQDNTGLTANYFLAWDRAQHRMIALGNLANPPALFMSDHALLLSENAGDGNGSQLSVIDTDALPK